MPPSFRSRPASDRKVQAREADERRGSARERGYSRVWDKSAKGHRRNHPLCRYCELQGNPVTPATHTDHLYPHRIYPALFWVTPYWVSSCGPCHSGFKQAIERQGRAALDTLALALGLPPLEGVGGVESPEPPRPGPAG